MPYSIEADSLEEIHAKIVDELLNRPEHRSSPRGKLVHELLAATFTLRNPRNRLIKNKARNVNYGFAVGELCWYLRGDNDLETLLFYNKRASAFSDDGKTVESDYGGRLFNTWTAEVSQWDMCKTELLGDPDSRRAIMHINETRDLYRAVSGEGTKDVPCTLSIQLFIRDRKLHMHVVMRSNDCQWGTPYDVFSFTVMQELFMIELREFGCPVDDVGSYHHTCGSLHLYDYHFDAAKQICDEYTLGKIDAHPMPAIEAAQELQYLSEDFEPMMRRNWRDPSIGGGYNDRQETESDSFLDWSIHRLIEHRNKRIRQNG